MGLTLLVLPRRLVQRFGIVILVAIGLALLLEQTQREPNEGRADEARAARDE